jgi:rhodanese-related sulfurtransferase
MRPFRLTFLGLAVTPLLALAQTSATSGSAEHPTPQAHVLTRAELDTLLAKPGDVLIVDLRRPDELASIGGFPVYLSIQPDALEKSLALIPRERTIVTVSNRVNRSGRAAELLTSRGFKVAGAIGARDYEEQGGTLTKIVPPAR